MDNNDPKKKSGLLKYRVSNFQPLRNKRPFENTNNYQNHMQQNRMDPRLFSVYKIVEEPKGPAPAPIFYVEDTYVESGYIEVILNYI